MNGRDDNAHDFVVVAVQPAKVEKRIAVTLTDARGGRVTLHLENTQAKELRDILTQKLG